MVSGFRHKENKMIMDFIGKETDIPESIICGAAKRMLDNDFHNNDHMFLGTRAAIEIGIAEGRSRQQINLLALVMLCHDANHRGVAASTDEVDAFRIALNDIPPDVLELCRENKFQNLDNMLRDGIMSTCFSMRGKISDPFLRIIQDADIHHCGVTPIYWVFAAAGMALENARQFKNEGFLEPLIYWKGKERGGNRGFVAFLESVSGSDSIFLSYGAKKLWSGDARANLEEIESWSDERIMHAFDLRVEDLTLAEYGESVYSVP